MGFRNLLTTALSVSATASSVLAATVCKDVERSVSFQKGTITGYADASGNSVFLGIPFAETTGGNNRYATIHKRANDSVYPASSVACLKHKFTREQMEGTKEGQEAAPRTGHQRYLVRSYMSSGYHQRCLQSPG